MTDTEANAPALSALPKGRHNLSRDQVQESQRLRLAVAMADACADSGYAKTPVAAVLDRAGVSRQTFYELYENKLDCFLDALDLVGDVLLTQLRHVLDQPGEPIDQATAGVDQYLRSITDHPAFARLYIIEVHAAGPRALIRRAELQSRVVDALTSLLDVPDPESRFALESYVAAISALVTLPIVTNDSAAIHALRGPLVLQLRTITDRR